MHAQTVDDDDDSAKIAAALATRIHHTNIWPTNQLRRRIPSLVTLPRQTP